MPVHGLKQSANTEHIDTLQKIAEAIMAMGSMSPNFTGTGMRGTGMATSRQPGGAFRSPIPATGAPATGGPPNGMVYSQSQTPSATPNTSGPPNGMVYNYNQTDPSQPVQQGASPYSGGMTGAFDPTGTMGFVGAKPPNGGWNNTQPPPPSFGGGNIWGGPQQQGGGWPGGTGPTPGPYVVPNSGGQIGTLNNFGGAQTMPGQPTGGQVIHGRPVPAGGGIGGTLPPYLVPSPIPGGSPQNYQPLQPGDPGYDPRADRNSPDYMGMDFPMGTMGAPGSGQQPFEGMTNSPGPTMPGQPSIADLVAGGGTPQYRTQAGGFWNPASRFPGQGFPQLPTQTPNGYPINW